MSMDVERYADFYKRFGDEDIQKLLQKAATLSRRRGRPEILFIDNPVAFHTREDQIIREIEERLMLQHEVVSLFTQEAPVGSQKSLYDIAEPFKKNLGESLSHEVPIGDLLLPARIRTPNSREEKILLQESQRIAPGIKATYNKMLQTCMKAGLMRVGDIRNVAGLSVDFLMKPLTSRAANFFRIAL